MGKVGEERLEKPKASTANVGIFIEKASRYTAIDRLTPELLRLSPAIVLKKYLENRIPIAWIQQPRFTSPPRPPPQPDRGRAKPKAPAIRLVKRHNDTPA